MAARPSPVPALPATPGAVTQAAHRPTTASRWASRPPPTAAAVSTTAASRQAAPGSAAPPASSPQPIHISTAEGGGSLTARCLLRALGWQRVEGIEFLLDAVRFGELELAVDGERFLPGVAGASAVAGGVVGVAEAVQRVGLVVAVA